MTTFLTERQRAIMRSLRHGSLDSYQIAAELGEAEFQVRGDLKALRRIHVVRFRFTKTKVEWQLTDRGAHLAWDEQQMQLGVQR